MRILSLSRSSLFLFLFPVFVLAAPSNFKQVAELFIAILKGFIGLLFASLAVALVYGVLVYFMNADNEKTREEIKGHLLWGVIGITVVFGLWGILWILSGTLGWGNVGIPIIRPPV